MNPYVSRGGDKLAAANCVLKVEFTGRNVLDVGASTGGFSDYAMRQGARRVIAVDKGTRQLHSRLRNHPQVINFEKTDITLLKDLPLPADLALIDVAFTSLKQILPAVNRLLEPGGQIIALFKPQFEAHILAPQALHQGTIKNERWRRRLIKDFEVWLKDESYQVLSKVDSTLTGLKGHNRERFYLLGLHSND